MNECTHHLDQTVSRDAMREDIFHASTIGARDEAKTDVCLVERRRQRKRLLKN